MKLGDDFLYELRLRTDIENLVASYVRLKQRGRILVGLCPFHNEKTPSFTVYPESQSYYCFGCGAGGDCITFVKTAENLDYMEAVRFLAEKANIPMPTDGFDEGLGNMKRRLLEANRKAARFFHNTLLSAEGKVALDYLLNRGIKLQTIKRFGLGFAPNKWDALTLNLKADGFVEQELINADLVRKTRKDTYIDAFRNRIMFPIIDLRGNVIAFGGRVLDDSKPKYLNTSDTLVYKKSHNIYGLNLAKNSPGRTLILCEGYMDVIAFHQAGFEKAVAGLGTALTTDQAKLLSNYADELILAYDTDEAGVKATKKAISVLSQTLLKLRVLNMEGGKDPDEIISKHGKDYMQGILEGAVNSTEFKLLEAKKNINTETDDGKVAYLKKAVEVLSNLNNAIERDVYITKLANELSVNKDAISVQVRKNFKKFDKRQESERFLHAQKQIAGVSLNKEFYRGTDSVQVVLAEETLIASLLQNPDYLMKIDNEISTEDFITESNRRLFGLIRDKILDDRPLELSFFSQELSTEEMGILSKVKTKGKNIGNTVEECNDCIRIIKKEKEKRKRKKPAEMSDDEFLKLFIKKE